MRSGRIKYRAKVAAIVLTSALLVKKESSECMFMLMFPCAEWLVSAEFAVENFLVTGLLLLAAAIADPTSLVGGIPVAGRKTSAAALRALPRRSPIALVVSESEPQGLPGPRQDLAVRPNLESTCKSRFAGSMAPFG